MKKFKHIREIDHDSELARKIKAIHDIKQAINNERRIPELIRVNLMQCCDSQSNLIWTRHHAGRIGYSDSIRIDEHVFTTNINFGYDDTRNTASVTIKSYMMTVSVSWDDCDCEPFLLAPGLDIKKYTQIHITIFNRAGDNVCQFNCAACCSMLQYVLGKRDCYHLKQYINVNRDYFFDKLN